jgi:hypothetical protein
MIKPMLHSKTTWTGVSAITVAMGAFFMGELVLADFLQTVVISLIGIFLRDGINTTLKK